MRKVMLISIFAVFTFNFLSAQTMFNDALALNFEARDLVAVATWDGSVHDFGTVEQGTPVSHTFYFTNTGNKPMTVTTVKPSCGCTAADYSKEEIQPGETGYVKATFNAKSKGVFTKTVSVTYDAEDGVKVLKLRGEVE